MEDLLNEELTQALKWTVQLNVNPDPENMD